MAKQQCVNRGQSSGSDAWILVGIIGLLMLFYILFLPPQDRERLLSDQPGGIGQQVPGLAPTGVLLKRTPGRLDALLQPGFDHAIPTFKVVELKNAQVLASLNPFSVTNSWLGEYSYKTTFLIDNPELVDAPLLVFEAPVRRGILKVKLNDKWVYAFEPSSSDVPPIMLKRQDLVKENTVEFLVSGVGVKFWSKNRYDILNARLLGDVSDISRQRAQNIFTLSPQEKESLTSAVLNLVPECDQAKIGVLDIVVNNRQVYSGVPLCNTPFQTELDRGLLHDGLNELMFVTQKGSYTINLAKVSTKVKQTGTFIEYFELSQAVFNEVVASRRRVELQVDFVDDGQPKRATLNVNGHLTFIDQRQPFYARPINPWVLPGPRNYIELRPESNLNIAELRVVVR